MFIGLLLQLGVFPALCLLNAFIINPLIRLTQPSTLEMVVPAHAVGKVIGKGGMNLENIRKVGPLLLSTITSFFA